MTIRRPPFRAVALLATVFVAACGGQAAGNETALKHDLDAASGNDLALAPRASQTQVVSALELGKAGAAAPKVAAPAPAPQRPAAPAPKPLIITRVRYVDRAPAPAPAPAPEPTVAAAPEPQPTPAPAERAPVASPSPGSRQLPQTTDAPARGRGRRGTWDMGDVIRNAPFPINP